MNKRSISAKALVADIKEGLSDAELMSRHELSEGQLQKVFVQLVKAGYVAQEELDGRRQQEVETSSAGPRGSNVTAVGPEAHSSEPPHPIHSERRSPVPSSRQGRNVGMPKPSTHSLPLSREEAARVRRNGLIFIIAAYGFVTMGMILGMLDQWAKIGSFPKNDLGVALRSLAGMGWLVATILGCLWRVRGLGQHPVWAIVAPCPVVNLVVVEALSNRYEPDSDRRDLRVVFAVFGGLAWWIVMTLIFISVRGLP